MQTAIVASKGPFVPRGILSLTFTVSFLQFRVDLRRDRAEKDDENQQGTTIRSNHSECSLSTRVS